MGRVVTECSRELREEVRRGRDFQNYRGIQVTSPGDVSSGTRARLGGRVTATGGDG